MPTDITLAFAGHAPNAKSNINAQLSDFLHLGAPDSEGYYQKPDRWGQLSFYVLVSDEVISESLKDVINLALGIEGSKVYLVTGKGNEEATASLAEYVDAVLRYDDPLKELVDLLADASRPYLFMNWDENDADDEHLINLAHQHEQIRVSDFVQGGMAIVPDTEEPEEDVEEEAEEEEAVEEQAPPRRSRPRQAAPEELDETPEELEEAGEEESPEEEASPPAVAEPASLEEDISAARRQMTQDALVIEGSVSIDAAVLRGAFDVLQAAAFYMTAMDTANATKNMAASVQLSPLTRELEKQAEALNAALTVAEPYEEVVSRTTEKPKKSAGKGTRVIWDEDQMEWKKAPRGRPRSGARTGMMDADGNVTEG